MLYFRGRMACSLNDPKAAGNCRDDFISISGVSKFVLLNNFFCYYLSTQQGFRLG